MAKLTYFRAQIESVAATYEYIRLYVGNAKLRIINCNNATVAIPPCRISLAIVNRNLTNTAVQTISLFHRQDQIEAGIDIGWEGDIEIGADQDLIATFENTTNLDILYLTAGVELL